MSQSATDLLGTLLLDYLPKFKPSGKRWQNSCHMELPREATVNFSRFYAF